MTSPELMHLFENPPREFGPTPLWWWSGATVTPDRLAWQLERYDEGGIHNLVVINLAPAGPLFGAQADDPAWFSETWWERFVQTCEIATERDMKIWFYDQIGFSGANIQGSITNRHPEAAGLSLDSRVVVVESGRVTLTGGERLVGAYRSADGQRLECGPSGEVVAADGTSVRVVVTVPTAFDYLSENAVALIMETIHAEYDRRVPEMLGSTIPGSFQDEAPSTNAWTSTFADEFRERRGYDLLDHLPALFEPGDREAAKVRGDYYAVRSDLTERAFFRPIGQWHAERGMIVGADQSNPARAGYPTQATQIYTDYFRTHRWYGAAGSDHEGDSKVHSSMAHLYDHPRVWIESFHSSGWGGTLEDTFDWLLPFLRSGANLYNPHATYFGTAGGWFEWAPPSTDWRQPYWQQYPAFSKAVSRIASMMSWGTFDAEVALLHPTATAQAALTLDLPVDHFGDGVVPGDDYAAVNAAQETYLSLAGVDNWFRTRRGALDEALVAFDVVDDDSVQRSAVAGGALAVAGQTYRAVVVPAATVLEGTTATRLAELLDAGGRVLLVGADPAFAAGRDGDDTAVARLAAHARIERYGDAAAAAEALADLRGHAVSDVPILTRRNGREGIAMVTGAFPNASGPRRTDETWLWPDNTFDPSLYASERSLTVSAPVVEASVLNPATGEAVRPTIRYDAGTSIISFATGGAPVVLVTWTEAGDGAPDGPTVDADAGLEAPAEAGTTTDVSAGWTGELMPTLDNTWGDFALPIGTDVDRLQIWNVDWHEGDGSWAPAKATYGNRVRVLGPVAESAVPASIDADEARRIRAGDQPLAGPAWRRDIFSSSRGLEDPGYGMLGNKGLVPEEFVRVDAPGEGEAVIVRTLVETGLRGTAELVVGAGAEKTVWWNGVLVATSEANYATATVEVDAGANVLEYRLGPTRNAAVQAVAAGPIPLGSSFTLSPAGTGVPRPVFMGVPETLRPDGTVRYSADVVLDSDVSRARLVVGSAVGVTVVLDGRTVARQEKVEYYESEWGANPAFFLHDVTASLTAGTHRLELVADSASARDLVFADLVAETAAGPLALVSGAGWAVATGGAEGATVEHLGGWGELAPSEAARRPHPLAEAAWLVGEPVVGRPRATFRTTDDVIAAPQVFRFVAPAGSTSLELPLALDATVTVDGRPVESASGRVDLAEPVPHPVDVIVTTEPTRILRGGSAWTGPVRVTTARAPIELGDWRGQGLGSWSGGVVYRRTLHVDAAAANAVVDLGLVRGSVRVSVGDAVLADLFCAPFRVDLGDLRGDVELSVRVNGTLAAFLEASTPTAWVFPSQRVTGLMGPVTLETR